MTLIFDVQVVCVIFESRPDAVVQIASLCLKTSNAVILKGGKEAKHSNQALAEAIQEGVHRAGLPRTAVQLVATREEVLPLCCALKVILGGVSAQDDRTD